MKKLILLSLIFALTMHLLAQSVSYTYRPLAAEGCSISYTPLIANDTAYIVVSVHSDRLVFNDTPTMMVRFFEHDEILKLSGKNQNTTSTSSGVFISNVLFPIPEVQAVATFMVTEEQMAMFNYGVSKIRITMLPMNHERTFDNDKIGRKLYQNYQKVKQKNNEF